MEQTQNRKTPAKGEKNDLYGYTREEYARFRRKGLVVLILFSLLYMSLYCCRLNLSYGAPLLTSAGFDTTRIGVLTGLLFWSYGIGQIINGRLSEIVGQGRFICLAALLSPLMSLLFGFADSFAAMAILWTLNGYFQSMAWGPGVAVLTNWWPSQRRGFALGFAHAFSGFGQALAGAATALACSLLPAAGWRAAFLLPPAVPLCFLLLWLLFAREKPEKIGLSAYREPDGALASEEAGLKAQLENSGKWWPYRQILSIRRFRIWMLIAFLMGLIRYGLTVWIPLYFTERHGVDITSGLLLSLALPVGMGIGTFLVPTLTDRFCPKDRLPAAVISSAAAAVAVALFLLFDPGAPGGTAAIGVTLFLTGFFMYAVEGISWTYAADLGGRVLAGTCTGILNGVSYMGAAAQSLVYGFFLKRMGWNTVFFSIAFFSLCVSALGLWGRKK